LLFLKEQIKDIIIISGWSLKKAAASAQLSDHPDLDI